MSTTIVPTVSEDTYSPKIVSWETVRNTANRLTNQLLHCCPEANLEHAHLSRFSTGPIRRFELEAGRNPRWLEDGRHDGWHAFEEADVCWLYWESASSGSSLEATKQSPGHWLLQYFPPSDNPEYRGCYFGMYNTPETTQNIQRPE